MVQIVLGENICQACEATAPPLEKVKHLQTLTVEELVNRFSEIGLAQDEALLEDEIGKFNRLYEEKTAITAELKGPPGDQRRALLSLYTHANAQVRLNAAKATLAVAPVEARIALQSLSNSNEYPQSGNAGMSLWNLDRGVFKPT
jgi:hypothetical protein